MQDELKINRSILRLVKGDYTDMEIDSIVYYAQSDLKLGSGFGKAIAVRGGPSIQEELKQYGTVNTTEVVMTEAGEMKTNYIIHAVGPKFQEQDIEDKLCTTVRNCLEKADEKRIKGIAFPPMGCGFYGVPLDLSAKIMIDTITEYLSGETQIQDIVISLLDNREYKQFQEKLAAKSKA